MLASIFSQTDVERALAKLEEIYPERPVGSVLFKTRTLAHTGEDARMVQAIKAVPDSNNFLYSFDMQSVIEHRDRLIAFEFDKVEQHEKWFVCFLI